MFPINSSPDLPPVEGSELQRALPLGATRAARPQVVLKRGDTARTLTDTLTIGGAPVDLTGADVVLVWRSCGTVERKTAAVVTAAEGTVSYTPTEEEVATAGTVLLEWEVTFPGGGVQTFPQMGAVTLWIQEDLG